jgi:hypothetical protein
MVGGLQLRLKRSRNDVFDAIAADLARAPHLGSSLCELLAPYANGLPGHANRIGDLVDRI